MNPRHAAAIALRLKSYAIIFSVALAAAGCADTAAQQAAQQRQADLAAVSLNYLREQTDQHRTDCAKAKSSADPACFLYVGDLWVSDHCQTYYRQFPAIDVACEARIEKLVHLANECNRGNQSSCVEIQYSSAAANQQRQAQQDALQQSLVQAQWAQAQAQAVQAQAQAAAAVQNQTPQYQRPLKTNCRPNAVGGFDCTQQ